MGCKQSKPSQKDSNKIGQNSKGYKYIKTNKRTLYDVFKMINGNGTVEFVFLF